MDQRTRKLTAMYKAKALHLRDDIDNKCREKNEEEASPTLKIALMHQYNDLNITLRKNKKELITVARSINDNKETLLKN